MTVGDGCSAMARRARSRNPADPAAPSDAEAAGLASDMGALVIGCVGSYSRVAASA